MCIYERVFCEADTDWILRLAGFSSSQYSLEFYTDWCRAFLFTYFVEENIFTNLQFDNTQGNRRPLKVVLVVLPDRFSKQKRSHGPSIVQRLSRLLRR